MRVITVTHGNFATSGSTRPISEIRSHLNERKLGTSINPMI